MKITHLLPEPLQDDVLRFVTIDPDFIKLLSRKHLQLWLYFVEGRCDVPDSVLAKEIYNIVLTDFINKEYNENKLFGLYKILERILETLTDANSNLNIQNSATYKLIHALKFAIKIATRTITSNDYLLLERLSSEDFPLIAFAFAPLFHAFPEDIKDNMIQKIFDLTLSSERGYLEQIDIVNIELCWHALAVGLPFSKKLELLDSLIHRLQSERHDGIYIAINALSKKSELIKQLPGPRLIKLLKFANPRDVEDKYVLNLLANVLKRVPEQFSLIQGKHNIKYVNSLLSRVEHTKPKREVALEFLIIFSKYLPHLFTEKLIQNIKNYITNEKFSYYLKEEDKILLTQTLFNLSKTNLEVSLWLNSYFANLINNSKEFFWNLICYNPKLIPVQLSGRVLELSLNNLLSFDERCDVYYDEDNKFLSTIRFILSSREYFQCVDKRIFQNFFAHTAQKNTNNHYRRHIYNTFITIYESSKEHVKEIIVNQFLEKNLSVNQRYINATLLKRAGYFKNYIYFQEWIDKAIGKIHFNFAYYFLCELASEDARYFQRGHIHKLIGRKNQKGRAIFLIMLIAKSKSRAIKGLENTILQNIFETEYEDLIFEHNHLYPLIKTLTECKVLHNEKCITYLFERYQKNREWYVLGCLLNILQQKKETNLYLPSDTISIKHLVISYIDFEFRFLWGMWEIEAKKVKVLIFETLKQIISLPSQMQKVINCFDLTELAEEIDINQHNQEINPSIADLCKNLLQYLLCSDSKFIHDTKIFSVIKNYLINNPQNYNLATLEKLQKYDTSLLNIIKTNYSFLFNHLRIHKPSVNRIKDISEYRLFAPVTQVDNVRQSTSHFNWSAYIKKLNNEIYLYESASFRSKCLIVYNRMANEIFNSFNLIMGAVFVISAGFCYATHIDNDDVFFKMVFGSSLACLLQRLLFNMVAFVLFCENNVFLNSTQRTEEEKHALRQYFNARKNHPFNNLELYLNCSIGVITEVLCAAFIFYYLGRETPESNPEIKMFVLNNILASMITYPLVTLYNVVIKEKNDEDEIEADYSSSINMER